MKDTQKQLEIAEFLQSPQWAEFQQSTGKRVVNLGTNGQEIYGFVHKLGLGLSYLYLPRAQVLSGNLDKLDHIFVRVETTGKLPITNYQFSEVENRQPTTTLVLDLEKSDKKLLSQMHSKTRYNIRLAEKKGVEIKQEKNIDVFWQLNQETTDRDEFKSHDKDYYKRMLEMDMCYQLTAYFEGSPIASNILIIYKDTCTYLHGASGDKYRNSMAPYLLQWEGIKLAKEKECKYYDFWGVAPMVDGVGGKTTCFNDFCWVADHKWTGVTRFKTGFGGEIKKYPRAVDIVLQKNKYRLYKFIKKFL
jgi:peptidoglycan pentaglycine glycine transferase (the first glycine)